jgi:4-hydroxybenzoate polyprenyltransferase
MNAEAIIHSDTSTVVGLTKLLRPRQWIKNGFVLAPLIFAEKFTEIDSILAATQAMVLFCVAASATYIVNDYRDIEHDRKHPVKAHTRPLASGQVARSQAMVLLVVLLALLAGGIALQPLVGLVIVGYLALTLHYTFFLKHQPVIDIFTIAIGFVLRVYAGAVALRVPVSSWMFVTTLCLALYLAAIKRRQELIRGTEGRRVLERYSVALVDRYAEMAAIGALLFYSLFVLTTRSELVVTVPFVLYGLFRYWYLVELLDGGESPTDALFSDWQLMATVAAWVTASGVSIWMGA